MRKEQVEIGKVYAVKVSGNIAPVKLTGESRFGGYDGMNLKTKRYVRIRSAARLRYEMVQVDGKWSPKVFSRPVVIAGNHLTEHSINAAMDGSN